jgi:hypothetical protein
MKLKKTVVLILTAVLTLALVGAALAKPKHSGVEPSADGAGNVTIPQLPSGTLTQVWVWNDENGTTKKLGAAHQFKLNPGDGFNFTWAEKGCNNPWWQMVTKSTQANGLAIDPWVNPSTGKVQCKYIYTGGK